MNNTFFKYLYVLGHGSEQYTLSPLPPLFGHFSDVSIDHLDLTK